MVMIAALKDNFEDYSGNDSWIYNDNGNGDNDANNDHGEYDNDSKACLIQWWLLLFIVMVIMVMIVFKQNISMLRMGVLIHDFDC